LRERFASSRSGQAWYMDFTIGLLLFTFALLAYFSYANNFQQEEKSSLELLSKDAQAISSSLLLSGYPNGWDSTSVVRIGIADEQKLNVTKVLNFKQINYTQTKIKFGTTYDYFVFFVNNKGEALNVSGVCGVGSPLINTGYGSAAGICNPINLTGINIKSLVNVERYLVYNSSVVKMVVYLWQ